MGSSLPSSKSEIGRLETHKFVIIITTARHLPLSALGRYLIHVDTR